MVPARAGSCLLVLAVLTVLAALPRPRRGAAVEDLAPPPLPAGAGADVEGNFDARGGYFPTGADNWEQRGALVRRAADADVFPPGFADANEPDVAKLLKPGARAAGRRGRRLGARAQQLSHVAGGEIVGDPAKVDEPGQGELIWSSDGTPVQPTPWDLQWDGGAPAWAAPKSGGAGAGGEADGATERAGAGSTEAEGGDMDRAQSQEEREAEAFGALPADESSLTFDEDFELAKKAAAAAEDRYLALSTQLRKKRVHRRSNGTPQSKHMWQYWATKDDDLKARTAGKVLKKAWELQRKYLSKMKNMCPMCSAMPGPKELSKMFCRTCEQFPESWGDKLIFGKPGARGEPFSGSPPNYLNDDARPLHHTPQDKGTWWGDNDAWYDGWEQHRTDLWPPYKPRYTDEFGDGKMLNGGGWKAMADDLNRGGNDYPEYKRTGMAPEYWERPGDEHDLDNVGKVSHADASAEGEQFLDAGDGGEITGGTSFKDDWEKIRAVDKLPPWCDRILGCPPPYNDIGEQDAGRSSTDKTTWSWPYNENGKKIQLGDHGRALLKEHHLRPHNERASAAGARANALQRANSLEQRQAALLEAHADEAESQDAAPLLESAGAAHDEAESADVQTAEREASGGAAALVTEPLGSISKMQGAAGSADARGAGVKAASVVPLFPPWDAEDSDTAGQQDGEESGEDDTNYPGFREWEWTGKGDVPDASADKDADAEEEDADERDRESARDRANLGRGHAMRTGWKAPVQGADKIADFKVNKSPRTQVLSEKTLSKELDYYLGSVFPGTFSTGD